MARWTVGASPRAEGGEGAAATGTRLGPARSGALRWLRPVLGLAITGAMLYLALGRLSWREINAALAAASVGPLLLALVFLAADFGLRLVRWWLMLRALDPSVPLRRAARPFLASLAINNVAPLRAGDMLRAFGFARDLGAPPARVLGTLLVERLLDLMMLLILFFAGLAALPSGVVPRGFIIAGAVAGIGCVAGVLALTLAPRRVLSALGRVVRERLLRDRGWAHRLAEWMSHFLAPLAMLRDPRLATRLVALTAVAWVLEGSVFAAAAWALHIHAAAVAPWFSLATGTLATLIPSSPGYVGTFDYFSILGLVAYGADRTVAAAFALTVHALLWFPVTVVGLLLLVARRPRGEHEEASAGLPFTPADPTCSQLTT